MIDPHEIKVTGKQTGVVVGEIIRQHQDLNYLNPTTYVSLFDGLDNMLEYVDKNLEPLHNNESEEIGNGDFHAFRTYDYAMNMFRSTPEKVVKFDPAELRIRDDNEAGTIVNYDVVGDYIDMGRYMEGIPESWGSMRNGNARNRRVNLILNMTQWAEVNQSDITHRGERILRLVDALEAGGVRTSIMGIESTQCNHTEVVIKRHEEPLTISDLAVISHPEFLRRIVFRIKEQSETLNYGYGNPYFLARAIESKPELLHADNNEEINIFIDSSIQGVKHIDDLFDKLERLLIWELSKPVSEVDAIRLSKNGLYFNPNGARSSEDIKREGAEAINATQ